MTVIRYAAYGSNLHPVRLGDRLPTSRLIGPGWLPGYSLSFAKRSVDGSGKCTIERGGDGVYVAVYEISQRDKERLDEIEGVGCGYATLEVDIPGFSLSESYIAEPSHTVPDARPYDWYRELVLLGCRYHGFPEQYIGRIEGHAADYDPDAVRREVNRQLINRMQRT